MDHLQIPDGAEHVKLRYLGTEEYDGGELSNYPQRQKWTRAELLGENDYGGRTKEEVNAFFQTWLFFGCLITIFRSVGVEVQTADFIYTTDDGDKRITTAKLPEFLQQWRTGSRKGGTWVNSKHLETVHLNSYLGRKTLTPVKSALEDHRRYMERYCGPGGALLSESAIAIVTLQWTLSSWERGINFSDWKLLPNFEVPEKARTFLRDRLLKARWCPSDIALVMRDMHLDAQYYIGYMRCPRYEDDHSNCDANNQKCGYSNKEWKYETRHTTEDCKCNFEQAPDATLDIIRRGGVPITSWKEGKLRVVDFDSGKMRYVAISHVWSDGMGNEVANALPRCQLERLQKLSEEVDYCRRHEPPPLPVNEMLALASTPSESSDDEEPLDRYADTELAGFWTDTLCVPLQPNDLRIDQIGKMRHIYKDASCVLVLDGWVQEVATTADISEKFARLYLSNWQHRLWTCQEGVFASKLYFQFHDGQGRLTELMEEAGLRKSDGPRKSSIPALALDIPAFNEGKLERFNLSDRVQPILEAVRRRATTKKKDETVCIATLLGLDPTPILRLDVDSCRDVCEQRMEKLIEMIKTLPQGLIFNKMERLTTPSYRWAPRTFLGQKLSDPLWLDHPDDRDLLNGDDGVFVPGHGLIVHFPAYLLAIRGEQAVVAMAINDGKQHFQVRLDVDESALRLRLEEHKPEAEPVHRIWKHRDYDVRDEKYALVTSCFGASDAILCALDTIIAPDFLPWPIHKLRYICLARVEPTKRRRGNDGFLPFRFHKKWEWLID